MQDTPALITAAQHGDQTALTALYLQHQPALHRYITRRAGPAQADDLAQETWARALRSLHGYEWTGRPFDAWLVTIARNLICNHAKRAVSQREVLTDDPGQHRHAVAPGPEEQVFAELDAAPVRAAVGTLPAAQRQALALTHWAGLSTAQISAHTGRSPGAVRLIRHRAAASLRRQLAGT